ncbi:MAG: 7-cyano-7-deazaguanine synthase QueC [Gammaproteobacteria bacterium]|nr:7-cyano-7-deazaguanine synthase QueC [Gammaproteobacteria bacterium]MDH4313900.1 7-cyano-7-deazaguanine synthase QueC [Gammaproteobacteria bacterium]
MKTASARKKNDQRALVVFSGGQDSTTCLFWAMREYGTASVETLTFDYGQRHRIELSAAKQVADFAGVKNTVLPINTFAALGGNAITDSKVEVPRSSHSVDQALPATFVPGRNLVFLTYAAAFAWQRDIRHLVTGVAQTDYSGYPDCRQETIAALQNCLCLAMERDFEIHTPLMHLSKGQTVELAVELGALQALGLSHTCYNGERPPCGNCAACELRAKGFAEAGVADPLLSS